MKLQIETDFTDQGWPRLWFCVIAVAGLWRIGEAPRRGRPARGNACLRQLSRRGMTTLVITNGEAAGVQLFRAWEEANMTVDDILLKALEGGDPVTVKDVIKRFIPQVRLRLEKLRVRDPRREGRRSRAAQK